MKITIEPTESQKGHNYDSRYPRVIVEDVSDELTVHEAFCLYGQALVAWGYHSERVQRELDGREQ